MVVNSSLQKWKPLYWSTFSEHSEIETQKKDLSTYHLSDDTSGKVSTRL